MKSTARVLAVVILLLLSAGRSEAAGRPAGSKPVPRRPAGSKPAPGAHPKASLWQRWEGAWTALEREKGDLLSLARTDSARSCLQDSICGYLARADSAAWTQAVEEGSWARPLLLVRLAESDPCTSGLLRTSSSVSRFQAWNADGELGLAVGFVLFERHDWEMAAWWLDHARVRAADRPFAVSLLVETELARGDTLGAGVRADSALTSEWPGWCRADLEQARILASLCRADTASARGQIGRFSKAGERRGFYLKSLRRLALLKGQGAEADSLTWLLLQEYPGGNTADQFLRALVSSAGVPPPGLSDRQKRILLAVSDARADLDRYRVLESDLRDRASPAEADTMVMRGMRLAFRAKEYTRLVLLAEDGTWRPKTAVEGEWGLILARALRNTGRIDSMSVWYGRVAERGTGGNRPTALWEWAREMEAQRRLREADTLYARFLSLEPGDRRAAALLRRGICRYALKDWGGARSVLTRSEAAADSGEKPAARFWLYRVALAEGDTSAARAFLLRAGEGVPGYYTLRARSALKWAHLPHGVSWRDPEGFWRVLARISSTPALSGVRPAMPAVVPASWKPPAALAEACERLMLFRRYGRDDWARLAKGEIEEAPALGGGSERVGRLDRLGLSDLGARAAVRNSLGRKLRYPTPFAPEVAAAARRLSMAPEWVWAIMRSESFFESSALSGPGAIGLMQLMPETARMTADEHRIPAEPLRSPRINLLLGMAHLGDLVKETSGSWPMVAAAYNAGIANANRWKLPGEDTDFYIEMIGYRETRDYVRRTLEGFWTYREILHGGL